MAADGRLKAPLYVQFVMGVKNAMPVDKPTFDFYVETVKRLAPDAELVRRPGSGRARSCSTSGAIAAGGHTRTGLEDNLRLDRDDARAVERGAGRAHGRALRQVRPAGGDARREARAILGLRAAMISPFDGAITAGLYGDPEVAAFFADEAEVARDARGRGRARPRRGRARHHPGGERPGDRARGRARSSSTPRRSPPAWPRRGCRWRRSSPPSGASSAGGRRVAALGRHEPGRGRHRAGVAPARGARGARRAPGAADRGARGAGAAAPGDGDRRADALPDRDADDARRQDRGLDDAAGAPPAAAGGASAAAAVRVAGGGLGHQCGARGQGGRGDAGARRRRSGSRRRRCRGTRRGTGWRSSAGGWRW